MKKHHRAPTRHWPGILAAFLGAVGVFAAFNYLTAPPDPNAAPGRAPEGMVWVPPGLFTMGSEHAMGIDRQPNSLPVHQVWVDGFWMDQYEVTNDQFAAFVQATGYKTLAERPPDEEMRKNALPQYRDIGAFSLVFTPPKECPEDCTNCDQWWKIVAGANWRHPSGPGSSIEGKGRYPVVHVAYVDAVAYADWAGKRLPTEAEWERAARGGLEGKPYYWGDELHPQGKWMANSFQGKFPSIDNAEDGHAGMAPVGSYPANGYKLYDMAGNVWEWCSDWYRPGFEVGPDGKRKNPDGPSFGIDVRGGNESMRVLRGGSYLCADSYCARYRAGGRQPGEVSTGQSHTGFRCVITPKGKR